MTHKAPTGARHAPCTTHVEHAYPSNGWLCIDDEPGRADAMRAFADHLVDVAARHRVAELDRPGTIVTDAARKVRPVNPSPASTFDPSGLVWHSCSAAAAGVDRGRKVRSHYLNAAGQCPLCVDDRCAMPAARCTVARCEGVKDAPVHDLTGQNLHHSITPHTFAPPAILGEATPLSVDDARWVPVDLYTAADHRPIDPAPVAEPVKVRKASPAIRASRRRELDEIAASLAHVSAEEAVRLADLFARKPPGLMAGIAERMGPVLAAQLEPVDDAPVVERWSACAATIGSSQCTAGTTGDPGPHAVYVHHEPVAEPETIDEPVVKPETVRPRSIAFQPAPAVLAPVLTVVQPSSRPTCARCGQTFRQSGAGAEWHRVNRPDCAASARPAVLAAV
jgi:hypothetical protein